MERTTLTTHGTRVAVVIVTYNSESEIGGLLASLPEALVDLSADVVVVDNGSQDGTVEVAGRVPGVRVVEAANHGYAAGINRGVALTSSEWLLVLNPDTRLTGGSGGRLVSSARHHGAGIVFPRIVDPSGRTFESLRRVPTVLRASGLSKLGRPMVCEMVTEPAAYERPGPVTWATGAAMLVSRAVHQRLGGWDESFFLYSEETDFCLRAGDAGIPIWYEPSAVVTHVGGGSGRDSRTYSMQTLNRVRLYARRHGLVRRAAFYAVVLGREAGRAVLLRDGDARRASIDLLRPAGRPPELGLANRIIPR